MYSRASGPIHLLILVLLLILLGTCASSFYFVNNEPGVLPAAVFTDIPTLGVTPAATFPPTPVPGVPSVFEAAPDTAPAPGWTLLQPGLERRTIEIYNDQNQQVETLQTWRLDQKYFRLDIAYKARPKSLEAWQGETNALMVVNGGFYSIDNERYFPDGLTIVNGVTSGHIRNSFEGLLAIRDSGAELRWLAQKPFDPAEPLQAALQSFPMLVEPGGGLGYSSQRESGASARRTVIAQDKQGRILFILAPQGYFTLHRLSVYLTESDLDLDIAINLDGGGSTGLLVVDPYEIIPTTRPIPFVILVYPR